MGINASVISGINALWTAGAERLKPVVYRRFSQGTYDAATGLVPQTATDFPLKVFLLDFELGQIDGSDVQAGDARCYIRASDLPIARQDDKVIEADGTVWNVKAVRGDKDFYHDLTLRR